MGMSFRKSIKVGKNTRVNLSKTGGIGLSTGVKGARVSCNSKGTRTQVGANGVYYRKDKRFGSNNINDNVEADSLKNTGTEKIGFFEGIVAIFQTLWALIQLVFWGGCLFLLIKFIFAIF